MTTANSSEQPNIRIWTEISVTLKLGDNFVKVTHGEERLSRQSRASLAKAREELADAVDTEIAELIDTYKRTVEDV